MYDDVCMMLYDDFCGNVTGGSNLDIGLFYTES